MKDCLKKQFFAFCALLGVEKIFSGSKRSRNTCSSSFKISLCTWNAFEFSKNQLFAIDGFCFFLKWPKLAKIPFWDWNFQQDGRKIENSTNLTVWNFYLDPQQSLNHKKIFAQTILQRIYWDLHEIYIISHYGPHFKVTFYGKKDCRSQISMIPRTVPIISRYLPTSADFDLRPKILSLKSIPIDKSQG